MTHPYNDFDTLLGDVWSDTLDDAEDDVRAWLDELVRDNIPGGWGDKKERILENINTVEFLRELISRMDNT